MGHGRNIIIALLAVVFAAACGAGKSSNPGDVYTDMPVDDAASDDDEEELEGEDRDEDGIRDEDEGRFDPGGPVDTDSDTIPDYEDEDSDNDTIPDETERGDKMPLSPPVDSDEDGTPDFRDLDSDDNDISDRDETAADTDRDGTGDYADLDNDGDTIPDTVELAGEPDDPPDYDGDGIPDYMDIDSDDDLITDQQEGQVDTDGDTVPDRFDLDSDGDTVPDSYEAGDNDYDTWPPDHDDDGYADFRDVDSDSDGLADDWEIDNDLDPYNADTDGDEFDDLIEIGAESDPRDPDSNPRTVGNFFFIVDYAQDPVPPEADIVFTTNIKYADIFFLMDTTGSMGGEIEKLREDMLTVVIPRISDLIEDAWYGVGGFDDYPVPPYGAGPPEYNDRVFYLEQKMTDTGADVVSAMESLRPHYGDDCSESHVPALYATATGTGSVPYFSPQLDCDLGLGEYGYPCFRQGAVPIVMMITDAPFHNGPDSFDAYEGITPRPPTYDEAVAALRERHAKVLSIVSSGGCDEETAMSHAIRLAEDTGTIDSEGEPVVFTVSGSGLGLGLQVVAAVQTLSGNIPVDVSISPRDDLSDDIDALALIGRIMPSSTGGAEDPLNPGSFCVSGLAVEDIDDDTNPDIFLGIIPGTVVCYNMEVNINYILEATDEPQTFKAYLDILADQVAILDSRQVIFMVPPHIEGPGVPL